MRPFSVSVFASAVLCTGVAASKSDPTPRALPDLEAQVKQLSNAGAATAARFEAFAKHIGLAATCPKDACKSVVATKWLTINLDGDAQEEKVLAVTTVGAGACAPASLEVFVLDSTPKGWVGLAHTSLRVAGAAKPTSEVTARAVHSADVNDLLLRIEGECPGSPRERRLVVHALESGKLQAIASSADFVGSDFASHAIVGPAPAKIELVDAKKTTTVLWFDEEAFAYDAMAPYSTALKSSTSDMNAETLSTKECAAPLTGDLAATCGLKGKATLRVVVKNGKAIGLTVEATSPTRAFARCMRKQVAAASWPSVPGATGCIRTFSAG